MKIITLDTEKTLPDGIATVVTVGNFDGAHKGHARLVERAVAVAKERGAAAAAVTFEPHTRAVVYPELSTKLLATFDEKAALLRKMGVNYMFLAKFDENFRAMTQEEFIAKILVGKLNAVAWVMGEGHHVGKKNGDAKKNLHFVCAKYHISMFTEPLTAAGGTAVSSTRIRGLIGEGRVTEANAMLGHPYLIAAKRAKGAKIATKLGFPTLNFNRPDSQKVLPPAGVYAAEIEIGRESDVGGDDGDARRVGGGGVGDGGGHGDGVGRGDGGGGGGGGGQVGQNVVNTGSGSCRVDEKSLYDGNYFSDDDRPTEKKLSDENCHADEKYSSDKKHPTEKSCRLTGALYFGDCPTFEGRDMHFEFHALDVVSKNFVDTNIDVDDDNISGKKNIVTNFDDDNVVNKKIITKNFDMKKIREPQVGETVNLWIHKFIRRDIAFSSENELSCQIKNDINQIKKYFSEERMEWL